MQQHSSFFLQKRENVTFLSTEKRELDSKVVLRFLGGKKHTGTTQIDVHHLVDYLENFEKYFKRLQPWVVLQV